ncbi:APC family permease [Mycolicibacterium sp. P9-64]|uniref:APC family permease n=1 Tax=Mycolicibacterium sp. P9-64 TaxID=2024612 RepID=UPI0018D9A85B|nr:APC family permease [Mycolicibacterium sp. P9-64]
MSVFDIVFTVLAFNAPMSVFVGFITVIIGIGNGIAAPVSYLGCGALMLFFAVGFAAMSRRLPNPGAFYAYITAGLGRPLGLGAAFVAVVSYVFILIGGYAFGGIAWQALVRDVLGGPDLPWYLYTAASMVVVAIFGYFRIQVSARVLMFFMCFEVIAMIAYDTVVFVRGGANGINFESFHPAAITSGSIGLAVLFSIVCFSGFEATAIFREEARDPERTIPRATYWAVGVMAGLYALTSWAMVLGIGVNDVVAASAADPTGTALATAQAYLGKVGVDVINVLLCTSIFAANLAAHNVTTRYEYSLSVDGIFPKFLSAVHKTEKSPHRASITTTIISFAALLSCIVFKGDGTTLYAVLVGIGGYALIVLLLLTSASVIAYFRRKPDHDVNVWKSLVAPGIASAGLVVAFVLATNNVAAMIGGDQALANLLVGLFVGLLVLGVIVALVLRRARPDVYQRIGRQSI